MKVVLTAVNAKYIHSNLAVYNLKAYAKEWQCQIEIAEYTINQQQDNILMDLYKQQPDILAFSCYIWNLSYITELIPEIHKILPNTKIWIGGPEVSYETEAFLSKFPQVSGIITGEGERTFCRLMEYWNGQNTLAGIQGIVYRDDAGEIHSNPSGDGICLDEIPFVYEDLDCFKNRIIYYETSRGCPFSCSYCLSSVEKQLRFRSLHLVEKELQFFLDHEVPQVKFIDRTFNCNHKHAMAIWEYILEHDNGITNFHFEISADILLKEELAVMSRMRPGLIQIEIGIQSTNDQVLAEIDRKMNFEQVKTAVLKINEAENVHQHLDLIAGLPFENMESFIQSFNDVYRLKPEQLQLGFLKVLKGSRMYEKAGDYGLAFKELPPYEVLYTEWISYDEILWLKGIEEMVEVYYNSGQFAHTLAYFLKECETPFQMFDRIRGYYEENGLFGIPHSRNTRFEILLEVIRAYKADELERYQALLTYDYYLRENAKNRPSFAPPLPDKKQEMREFYQQEEQKARYLMNYEGFLSRQLQKMTHLEYFNYDVKGEMEEGEFPILFDYRNRNQLNYEAGTYLLEGGEMN